MEDLCGRRQWGGVIDKRYSMTDQEEVWYVMAAESAHCICVSPIPAGRQKNFGNEDIKPAAYKERKMDQKRFFDVNDACWRTGHECHECEDDTLKPRRWRVYPDSQFDCKRLWRFVLDQLLGQRQELLDTKTRVNTTWNTRENLTDGILQGIIMWLAISGLDVLIRRDWDVF